MPFLSGPVTTTPLRTIVILLVLLLAAHAPMMLNDAPLMDDWLVLMPRPDYAVDIDFLLNGAGHPIFFSYYYLANLTGEPILAMKVLALTGICAGSVCLVLAATRLRLLTLPEATGFALIVWTYPGYQLWAGKANAVYVLSFGLLFVGGWVMMLAFAASGARHVLLRIAALLLFLLSFALNSTMVLYAFMMAGLFFAVWRGNDSGQGLIWRVLRSAWEFGSRYPDLIVLPLVYWGALNIWFPRVGVYTAHYNAHLPTLAELMDGWRSFFLAGYRDVLTSAARAAAANTPALAVAAVLITVGFFLLGPTRTQIKRPVKSAALPLLLCVGVFMALSLPYLIAGLQASNHFYESRHLLMFGVPSALSLLWLKRQAQMWVGEHAAFAVVFGLASILSMATLWDGYVFLQARALKQEAFTRGLAGMAKPAATVFSVNDGFVSFPSRHTTFGIPEVSGMLRLAWGNRAYLGFSQQAERPSILQEMKGMQTAHGSAFRHIDPTGPQATILFQPGPAAASNVSLVRRYYGCRLLARCDVSAFLGQLALLTVEEGPIAGITQLDRAK
jgi:hypothetical protein